MHQPYPPNPKLWTKLRNCEQTMGWNNLQKRKLQVTCVRYGFNSFATWIITMKGKTRDCRGGRRAPAKKGRFNILALYSLLWSTLWGPMGPMLRSCMAISQSTLWKRVWVRAISYTQALSAAAFFRQQFPLFAHYHDAFGRSRLIFESPPTFLPIDHIYACQRLGPEMARAARTGYPHPFGEREILRGDAQAFPIWCVVLKYFRPSACREFTDYHSRTTSNLFPSLTLCATN
jgi:hypothetical protein